MRFPAANARDFLSPDRPFSVRPVALEPDHAIRSVVSDPLVAIAPLKLDGRIGAIVAGAPAYGDYEFSERKMKLLAGIANQAVLAISNANNFEILERTFLSTVEALANALEAKDEYTSSHARSITDMAFHAMTTDRPYRKRLSQEEAVDRLNESAGRQFDPRVVRTFVRLFGPTRPR